MKMKSLTLTILLLIFTFHFMHAEKKQNKILSSSISLTNLSNNEELCVGKTVTIEWAGVDAAEEVIIEYSTNGGSNWIEITATATGLSYDWTVPNTPSENVLVRVKAPYDPCTDACVNGGVQIGTQIWSCKNLDVTTYSNGDPIPEVTSNSEWDTLTTGAWCYYNNDAGNNATYGKLYNWYAVNDPRGLAPTGWHVPTDAEWQTLIMYVGFGTAGGNLKETGTDHWASPNAGATNQYCFTALPNGRRTNGGFADMGSYAYWWSSTEIDANNAKYSRVSYLITSVYRGNINKLYGNSVRLVKDN